MTIWEWKGEVKSIDEVVLEEEENECLKEDNVKHTNEGELLAIECALNLQAKVDDEHENIFNTRCMIDKKVCGVIIDKGNYANVTSTNLVEKFNLTITKHPSPI